MSGRRSSHHDKVSNVGTNAAYSMDTSSDNYHDIPPKRRNSYLIALLSERFAARESKFCSPQDTAFHSTDSPLNSRRNSILLTQMVGPTTDGVGENERMMTTLDDMPVHLLDSSSVSRRNSLFDHSLRASTSRNSFYDASLRASFSRNSLYDSSLREPATKNGHYDPSLRASTTSMTSVHSLFDPSMRESFSSIKATEASFEGMPFHFVDANSPSRNFRRFSKNDKGIEKALFEGKSFHIVDSSSDLNRNSLVLHDDPMLQYDGEEKASNLDTMHE